MIRKKFPKNAKLRKKLGECLAQDGWTIFDIAILLGYSLKEVGGERGLNSFQTMMFNDDKYRSRMVNFYLEKYEIKAVS